MSAEISDDSFRANMIAQIKEIQEALNELKTIKRKVVKKSSKKKTSKRKSVKRKSARKSVKKKSARKSVKKKSARKSVKKKSARKGTKSKRKTSRRRQISGKPSYLTNLCPNQYENS